MPSSAATPSSPSSRTRCSRSAATAAAGSCRSGAGRGGGESRPPPRPAGPPGGAAGGGGEGGRGRPRLAHELAGRARALGWTVLWGGCSEAEGALPSLPFVEALGNHFAERSPAEIHRELGGAARELSLLFPQLELTDA